MYATNAEIMSTIEMREELHRLVDQVDETFLKALHALLAAYAEEHDPILGYRVDTGEPVRASQAEEEFEQIVQEVKQGDYITIEDLIKQKSSKW